MKTLYRILFSVGLAAVFASCNTDVEDIGYITERNTDHLAAIRAYKKTDHELIFGWWAGWNGGGFSAATALRSLPDSMDFVALWGADWPNMSPLMREDLRVAREERGLRVIVTMFAPKIGNTITPEDKTIEEYWGWDDNDRDKQEAAIRKYARAWAEYVLSFGFDGIDMDNEQEGGNHYGDRLLVSAFIEEVGKYMGPASGTERLFCVDGSLTSGINPECFQYISYFIPQNYGVGTDTGLDSDVGTIAGYYKISDDGGETYRNVTRAEAAAKIIPGADFELYNAIGGGTYRDRYNNSDMTRCEGFAAWKPLDTDGTPLRKGGAGLYHIENDYRNPVQDYYYVRKMIQIMNPAKE